MKLRLWNRAVVHVSYLAEAAGFDWMVRGQHVGLPGFSYGTALVSSLPMGDPAVHTFEQPSPTPPKGFSVSSVELRDGTRVDVVSVHLDFSSQSQRYGQVTQMIGELGDRGRPLVVMGDFNTEWDAEPTLRKLAGDLGLRAHRPESRELATFPAFGSRLDWILVSDELEFVDYRVLPDPVSDHLGVVAELRLRRPR